MGRSSLGRTVPAGQCIVCSWLSPSKCYSSYCLWLLPPTIHTFLGEMVPLHSVENPAAYIPHSWCADLETEAYSYFSKKTALKIRKMPWIYGLYLGMLLKHNYHSNSALHVSGTWLKYVLYENSISESKKMFKWP